MEKVDRRGFFTSIVATLLAPLVPIKEKWTFNRSHAIAYQSIGTLKVAEATVPVLLSEGEMRGFATALETPLRKGIWTKEALNQIVTWEPNPNYIPEESFGTFIVDTNEVV